MKWYNDDFIKKIPKTDLHVHLDGSLRIPTLIELAQKQNITLPSYTESGLRELVFKPSYKNLDEYLTGFAYTCAVMRNLEAIERISYELALDSFAEGVRYIEVRFAPQLLIAPDLGFADIVKAADKGLKRARQEINAKLTHEEPEFDYGIIICAMRYCNANFSPFYKQFFTMHQFSAQREIIRLASLEAAKAAVHLRKETDVQVVGFDIAGSEYGNPADHHTESYQYIHEHFLHKTVHAGEAFGPESIFLAITALHADRIGHGLFLFDESMITNPAITDKQRYIEDLVNYIADRRITIEVCLSSNLQTVPAIKHIGEHSLKNMLAHKLSVTFCTDNRLVSSTTVSREITLALDNFSITARQLKDIIVYGFKRSFYYGSYPKKREYVRKVINYYEKLEKEMLKN